MSLFEKLAADATQAEEAALYLLRLLVKTADTVHSIEADHPAVAEAVASMKAAVTARGIPVDTIETTVLRVAREFAALSAPGAQ